MIILREYLLTLKDAAEFVATDILVQLILEDNFITDKCIIWAELRQTTYGLWFMAI